MRQSAAPVRESAGECGRMRESAGKCGRMRGVRGGGGVPRPGNGGARDVGHVAELLEVILPEEVGVRHLAARSPHCCIHCCT